MWAHGVGLGLGCGRGLTPVCLVITPSARDAVRHSVVAVLRRLLC